MRQQKCCSVRRPLLFNSFETYSHSIAFVLTSLVVYYKSLGDAFGSCSVHSLHLLQGLGH